jgi:hypothetical protein
MNFGISGIGKALFGAVALAAVSAPAFADQTGFTFPSGKGGVVWYSGVTNTEGNVIHVNQDIVVTQMGYEQTPLTAFSTTVGIFDSSGNLLTYGTVTQSGTVDHGYVYTPFYPVKLRAGHNYTIAAMVTPSLPFYQNTTVATTPSEITSLSYSWMSGVSFIFPGWVSLTPHFAANIKFVDAVSGATSRTLAYLQLQQDTAVTIPSSIQSAFDSYLQEAIKFDQAGDFPDEDIQLDDYVQYVYLAYAFGYISYNQFTDLFNRAAALYV